MPSSTVRSGVRVTGRSRPVFFGLGLVLGVLFGAFGTIGSLGLSEWSGQGGAASAASASGHSAGGATTASTDDVLQIFGEEPDWGAGGPPTLGSEYQPESIRSVLGAAPAETGFGVYIAQRGAAEYCIIVQDADLSGSTACASLRTIATSGLHLHALVWSLPLPAGNSVLLQVYVTWTDTGAVVTGSAPRAACRVPLAVSRRTPGRRPPRIPRRRRARRILRCHLGLRPTVPGVRAHPSCRSHSADPRPDGDGHQFSPRAPADGVAHAPTR